MLSYLAVKNFAIIENIEVSFQRGLTVLTGETGAGKSILIDAIGLLLGDRASFEVIRSGENSSEIIGIFNALEGPLKKELNALDVDTSDDQLMIKRHISLTGANIIKLNNQTVTLQDLKRVTKQLADIHTQQDTRRLIEPEMYLYLLDQYDHSIEPLKHVYHQALNDYNERLNALQRLLDADRARNQQRADSESILKELHAHQLIVGEEEDITARLHTLHNFDAIYHAVQNAYNALETQGSLEQIFEAHRALFSVQTFDEAYKSLSHRLETTYYELDDVKQTLSGFMNALDFDPNALEQLEHREYQLKQLTRKYARSIDGLIDYQTELEQKLHDFEHFDDTLDAAKKACDDALKTLQKAASQLTEKRHAVARHLEQKLILTLADLQLKKAAFKVVFAPLEATEKRFKKSGQDTIDFLLTTNPGEPLKPLSKVASGGESSRIMLALKTLLVQQDTLALMIFDEIDSGVSGYVADQVGMKMYQLSQATQVIAITHLPQVAAWADHHYHITKTVDDARTKAIIKPLSDQERVESIAAMLASDNISDTHRKSASELLNKPIKKSA